MDTKMINDTASVVANALSDYMEDNLNMSAFRDALKQFPHPVAEHLDTIVNNVIYHHKELKNK